MAHADLILTNARITTMDERRPSATALASRPAASSRLATRPTSGRASRCGTLVIDAGGRRIIPGLNDSHIHMIRGGLNYNLELRWDGVPSLADALRRLKEQAATHAAAAVGARRRRLERVPVCRTPHADAAGDQRGGTRDAGVRAAPLRSRLAERRGAARGRLYEGHARPAGWRDRARRAWQPDRAADCQAEREHPVRDPRQGARG